MRRRKSSEENVVRKQLIDELYPQSAALCSTDTHLFNCILGVLVGRICILVVPMIINREIPMALCMVWYLLVALCPMISWWLLQFNAAPNEVDTAMAAIYDPIHRYSGRDGLFSGIAVCCAYLLAKRKAFAIWPAMGILVWRGYKGICTTLKDSTDWVPVWSGFCVYVLCVIVILSLRSQRILR